MLSMPCANTTALITSIYGVVRQTHLPSIGTERLLVYAPIARTLIATPVVSLQGRG
ncbi:MAG: hypothetical protein JWR21_1124 [Herminiimonas sp.]|nr:hypothetical protein [Herminiimonas sp.]